MEKSGGHAFNQIIKLRIDHLSDPARLRWALFVCPPLTGPSVALSTATALSVHMVSVGVLEWNTSQMGER